MTLKAYPAIINNYTKELSDYNGFNISCHGQSNGFIKLNILVESASYSFKWSGPGGFTASTKDISGLMAGQYTLLITDNNNLCTGTETIELTEPGPLSMKIDPSLSPTGGFNIACTGAKTGSITVSAQNNAGTAEYRWDDGYIGNIRTDLSAGTYHIILTDANSCHADATVTLTEPDSVLRVRYDVTKAFCPDKPDGEIRLTVTGGVIVGDYIYKWPDNSTGRTLSNILPGLYHVTVSDLNGCSVQDDIQVDAINDICLVIPEAISPNGDGINDVWNIDNVDLYPQMDITIYNRWGQAVWRSETGYPQPWDGKSNGRNLPLDSYHYAVDLHNGSRIFVGTITIVR
jgi:gliding motility-associated-like protein